MRNPFDYAGQVAVVIGGSGVLCGAIAEGLGEAGARVVVVGGTHRDRAEETAARIRRAGGAAEADQVDVLSKDAVAALADRIAARCGRVDILVNGAGGARPEATTSDARPFFDLPEDAVRAVFDLNMLGTFFACQAFGRIMVQQGAGCVLNISSRGAFLPLTRSVAYSAAKAAVTNFTQWLAVHLAQEYPARIRVNALVPGFFLTDQNRFLLREPAGDQPTERGRRIIAHTPMGRFGEPADIVGPALWLLSDAARFVHGATIAVDGGMSAFGGV
jgi:NAD(P)-dependent dehydrogenase (short-subunit alcohol dehydrogenase family)